MNNNQKRYRPHSRSQASVISITCDGPRRLGGMRSILLKNHFVNTDRIFGVGRNLHAVIDGVFETLSIDAQPGDITQ